MTQENLSPQRRRRSTLIALLITLRPHQWVKNLFVLTPLVFAQKIETIADWTLDSPMVQTLMAFGI